MRPFDGNDYRKRVLAAVQRRGGPETADLFELYDLPLDELDRWSDADLAAHLDEVWGFWQRQRDHPKYGTLVARLVAAHEENRADLLDRTTRESMALHVRGHREGVDAARFELLDGAVDRLLERHGGIPEDKVPGLVEIGTLAGLSEAEVHERLRRHQVVPAGAPVARPAAVTPSPVSDHRRQQVRDLLDEFGRLQEVPPPPTLLALLGLDPNADDAEIAYRAEGWRARCRELPPTRIRAVADELMVHVADLLESGPIVRDAYLDAVVVDVRERLRPRVRAAVLVEDRLVADDHEHLYSEALDLGLDPGRAAGVLAGLAAELGVPVEPLRPGGRPAAQPPPPAGGSGWDALLREARAAMRRGHLAEARRLVAQVLSNGDPASTTPARAVSDEVTQAIAEAELRWRAAATALGALRFAEAVDHLEHLARHASDLPPAPGLGPAAAELERARGQVAEADAAVEAARTGPHPGAALAAVLTRWPAHPAAVEALAAMPLVAPAQVRAQRDHSGVVVVTWQASATPGVTYKVHRVEADGSQRVVGRTDVTRIEDGGAPAGATPDYTVVALLAGRTSEEARTGVTAASRPAAPAPAAPAPAPAAPAPAATVGDLAAPTDVLADRAADGTVTVRWSGPAGVEFKVSRRTADGRWQVVGRTREQSLEDGGAPDGDVPAYAVEARGDGASATGYAAGAG